MTFGTGNYGDNDFGGSFERYAVGSQPAWDYYGEDKALWLGSDGDVDTGQALDSDSNWSIYGKFQFDAVPLSNRGIFGTQNISLQYIYASNTYAVNFGDSEKTDFAVTETLTDENRFLIIGNGTTAYLYINGSSKGSFAYAGDGVSGNLFIGKIEKPTSAENTYSLDLELSSSQYAYITDAAQTGLDITGDITVEAWIKLEQLPSAAASDFAIVSKDRFGTGADRGYYFHIGQTNNKLRMFCATNQSGTNRVYYEMDEAFVAGDVGTWIHIAVTVDVSAQTMVFYKNSALKSGTALTQTGTAIYDNAQDVCIGAVNVSGANTPAFDGLIDEVRVWNVIRTSGEISSNYQTELTGSETNLQGYWKFNNNYLDETSNNNDLTAVNTPVFSVDVPFAGSSIIQYISQTGITASPYGISVTQAKIYIVNGTFQNIYRYNSSFGFELSFGSAGTGDGQFSGPRDVSGDSNGNIYVADTGNNRIQKLNSSGTYQWKVGGLTSGTGNTEFNAPEGIFWRDNKVYVSDTGNNRIQVFSDAGVYEKTITSTSTLSAPKGICVCSNQLVVVDSGNDRVQRLDTSLGTGQTPSLIFGTSGTGDGQFQDPVGVCSNEKKITVVDSTRDDVQIFSSVDGSFIRKFGSAGSGNGQFNEPQGICNFLDDRLLVTDRLNNRFQEFQDNSPVLFGPGVNRDFQVYNRELSAGEITSIFAGNTQSSPYLLYDAVSSFQQSAYIDQSGNGRDGTLENSYEFVGGQSESQSNFDGHYLTHSAASTDFGTQTQNRGVVQISNIDDGGAVYNHDQDSYAFTVDLDNWITNINTTGHGITIQTTNGTAFIYDGLFTRSGTPSDNNQAILRLLSASNAYNIAIRGSGIAEGIGLLLNNANAKAEGATIHNNNTGITNTAGTAKLLYGFDCTTCYSGAGTASKVATEDSSGTDTLIDPATALISIDPNNASYLWPVDDGALKIGIRTDYPMIDGHTLYLNGPIIGGPVYAGVYGYQEGTTYLITSSTGSNGTISPLGDVYFFNGDNQSYVMTPDALYQIQSVLVDGSPVSASSPYTFTNISDNHTISVTFVLAVAGNNTGRMSLRRLGLGF
jgi:hypothetical protein